MKREAIAIVCNTGLGDALLFERLAAALNRAGYPCVLYSQFIERLAPLYQGLVVENYPADIDQDSSSFWQKHTDYLFQQYAPGTATLERPFIKKRLALAGIVGVVLGESYTQRNHSWLQHQAAYLQEYWPAVAKKGLTSSLQPMKEWVKHRHRKRVIIHPTSLKEEKNWPADKFIRLAQSLQAKGWEVKFCATLQEKAVWDKALIAARLQPMLALDLVTLAQTIYESAYFVGNDSGVAHLAPALGIATLKLFDRASRARFWSGGWPRTEEVLPWPLPFRALRVRYWKAFLTVGRALRAFEQLVAHYPIK